MSPLQHSSHKKLLLLLYFVLLFVTSATLISAQSQKSYDLFGRRTRMLLEKLEQDQELDPIHKKPTKTTSTVSISNNTKHSTNNQTKLIKPSSKNQTKIIKLAPSDSTKNNKTKPVKSQIKKLNSTSKPSSNSLPTKKSSDLPKITLSKNKTTKPTTTKETKAHVQKSLNRPKPRSPSKAQKKPTKMIDQEDEEDEDDFVSEFRDLPSKFQETFVPDLEKLHKTSKVYLTKYNKEFIKNFKPYVGNKYASTVASIVSFAFIIIPLIIVSLIFDKITAYFSIQKIVIFIQAYLAIYFTILGISTLIIGVEPLKLFYTNSQSTYVCVQVLQTLAYVLYLLLLLMYLILVFSSETGLGSKLLGLAQTFVGLAVGLHYYITVFHRAVLHQPPKTSWKVHGLYATCFFVICWLGRIDRRKKAYLEEGGEEGKKS